MRIKIGKSVIDVNVRATRQAYSKLTVDKCDCQGCKNYYKAVALLPKKVGKFFCSIGVDIRKPREIYACSAKDRSTMLYGGWYHICGRIITATNPYEPVKDSIVVKLNDSKIEKVANGYSVWFENKCDLLPEDFPKPSFQMEVSAQIPWVISADANDYFK